MSRQAAIVAADGLGLEYSRPSIEDLLLVTPSVSATRPFHHEASGTNRRQSEMRSRYRDPGIFDQSSSSFSIAPSAHVFLFAVENEVDAIVVHRQEDIVALFESETDEPIAIDDLADLTSKPAHLFVSHSVQAARHQSF